MTLQYHNNVSLAAHSTIKVGGTARFFVEVNSVDELVEAMRFAKAENLPFFALGEGSNLLVDDNGFDGVAIRVRIKGIEIAEEHKLVLGGGELWDEAVKVSCEKNWAGIEALSGIPSSCAGAAVQNIGAYGQEISEVLEYVEFIDPSDFSIKKLAPKDLSYKYRSSSLKGQMPGPVITKISLKLRNYSSQEARDRCLAHGFRTLGAQNIQTANQLRKQVLEIRKSKAMCYEENDFNTHSLGSFFTNPIVPETDASRISAQHIWKKHMSSIGKPKDGSSTNVPMFPVEGGVKLSAAWLIEQSGFERGYRFQNAALSQKHCLAIVNPGEASCQDVLALASKIARKVRDKFRITLSPEAMYLSTQGIVPMPLDLDSHKEGTGDDNIGLKL